MQSGFDNLPQRSDAAVLAPLDIIQNANGGIPADISPPLGNGEVPPFLLEFGKAWREADAALNADIAAQRDAAVEKERAERSALFCARDVLTRDVKLIPRLLHSVYPAPSHTEDRVMGEFSSTMGLGYPSRGARVLAEANALEIKSLKEDVRSLNASVAAGPSFSTRLLSRGVSGSGLQRIAAATSWVFCSETQAYIRCERSESGWL